MSINRAAATEFMATHARILDRRRFELRDGQTGCAAAVAALDGYRNLDGGYGWGLEPDLRSPESQPGAAAHAFEVFENIAPATAPQAAALCDWLESVSMPDGGLPFALPLTMSAGSGQWWNTADLSVSTHHCLNAIATIERRPFAYVLAFSVRFLDAVHDSHPEAAGLLRRLGTYIPADGQLRVQGGTEREMLHPLDLARYPDRAARDLFTAGVISADLDRLATLQQGDGGWTVDYLKISPAGSLDWRGMRPCAPSTSWIATVRTTSADR
jgi:hypothetical protein